MSTPPEPTWRCSTCGFSLKAAAPPEICPMCRNKCEFVDVSCYIPGCGGPEGADPRLK